MSIKINSLINLVGYAIPTLLSIPAMGYLARELGITNFGFFLMFFTIVGYASIFDLGLSRAVVREISLNKNDKKATSQIITTSFLLTLSIGVVVAVIFYYCDHKIASLISGPEQTESVAYAISILSYCLPFYLLNMVCWGILEGYEKFKLLNVQKTITGVLTALLPVIFIHGNVGLLNATLGLVIARIVGALLSVFFVFRNNRLTMDFSLSKTKALLSFGGWASISSIINPLLTNIDRFILSNAVGPAKASLYIAPADAISKLLILPTTIARTVFPALCKNNTKDERRKIIKEATLLISVTSIVIAIMFSLKAGDIITLWLGKQYSTESPYIFQILLVGFVFNSLAQVPFAQIQSKGYANITGLIHLVECIPYLLVLYFSIMYFSVAGVAYAWSARVTVDYFILMLISLRLEKKK
ncbi:O36 family O-antigen flippase [Escherichia coli]|uniref:O36 family O-antigen flippase n=1 Tax=Escherichia coli TaxID=562 RepID=A0AAI9B8T0_ECOLX|nr:O36 family O-antigen flippase [Escherichia coli]HDQ6534319.1 O36 family O-antigen flippase [Escherichia coli O36:H14]ANO89817.1 matE family protein [Escherichia coli]EFI6953718.1 O36 family O-antigen flippase [Escherichia coli]EFN1900931.1 O36 family O-antigen flippase [Escherichia coli]EHS3284017.1 O36 family O-antigen flippase [Escherichia coli]